MSSIQAYKAHKQEGTLVKEDVSDREMLMFSMLAEDPSYMYVYYGIGITNTFTHIQTDHTNKTEHFSA